MTSPSPLLYDTYYHIYNRGVNRENVFIEERNYEYFLLLYAKHIEPVAQTFAFSLLKNHFHVLVRIKAEEEIAFPQSKDQSLRVSKTLRDYSYPSQKFADFFNAYAKAINKAYGRTGSLFQHPFGRVPITNTSQFFRVVTYIHQNPQKHKFVEDFRDWKYSSYGTILSEKPTRLQRTTVLDWFGGATQYIDFHTQWITDKQSAEFAEDDVT
jgi:REP element-mobilizing transposase RayT